MYDASITSVDLKRLFLIYENILSDKRVSFTNENLVKYMVVNYFLI